VQNQKEPRKSQERAKKEPRKTTRKSHNEIIIMSNLNNYTWFSECLKQEEQKLAQELPVCCKSSLQRKSAKLTGLEQYSSEYLKLIRQEGTTWR